jgi:hypothetical protein
MEKKGSNYNNAKIFKIVNHINAECYYSCTIEKLTDRWRGYKNLYNAWILKNQRANTPNSFNLFKLRDTANVILYNNLFRVYVFNNCSIVLIEEYPCKNILELKYKLNYYINKYKCLNTTNNYLNIETDDEAESIISFNNTEDEYFNLDTMD